MPNALNVKERYEKKFLGENLEKEQLINIVKLNPFGFKETFYERRINSLYFDTEDLKGYKDNIDGHPNRRKVRIRWYGEDLSRADNANLEIKVKKGSVGYKEILSLGNIEMGKETIFKSKFSEEIETLLKLLKPVVLVSYSRKYFVSFNQKFRVTVDSDLTFYKPNEQVPYKPVTNQNGCILELKYALQESEYAKLVGKHIPFSLSKSSKYVMGIDSLHHNSVLF